MLGVVSAGLHTWAKLRLGIPGHAAMLWLTPIIVARCLVPLRGAATVGTTAAALGLYAFHGLSPRWPMVLSVSTYWLVGPALDIAVAQFDRLAAALGRSRSSLTGPLRFVFVPLAGVVANYAHLVLKILNGVIRPHAPRLGLGAGAYEVATYFVFGLVAGIMALILSTPFIRRRQRG